MENNAPKKEKILNTFDIVVIIIAVIAAAVLLLWSGGYLTRAEQQPEQETVQTEARQYVLEISNLREEVAENIKVGDVLLDSATNTSLGEIVSIELTPMETSTKDIETGRVFYTDHPTLLSAKITLEIQCFETDMYIKTISGVVLRVGKGISVIGPGYIGSGYIYDLMRGA